MITTSPERARAAVWIATFVAVAVFLPTLGYGYVYDDLRFVEANTALSSPSILWRAFADPVAQTADGTHAGLWRPLRTLSFAFDRAVFGTAAWGGHLINLLLHGAATVLLTRLLMRWGLGVFAAMLGALVYALHPVQIECVAWISSRGDLLAMVLVFASLHLQMSRRTAAALVCGAAALLAKEQAVVWPAFAVASALLSGDDWKRSVRAAVGPAVVVFAFVAIRHAVLETPLQEGGLADGRPGVAEMGLMLGHQAAYTLLPVRPLFDWQMPPGLSGAARLPVLLAALLPIAALCSPRTRVPALWFLAALVPTLFVQAVINLNIRVADRFLLFALPALAVVVAKLVGRANLRVPAVGAVAALLILTSFGLPTWASNDTLWEATAERVPGHWRSETWLGSRALEKGDYDAAVSHLHRAAQSNARDARTRFDYATALERKGAATDDASSVGWATRARYEFNESLRLSALPRQEHADAIRVLARLAVLDVTLSLGEVEPAIDGIVEWMDRGPPRVPEKVWPLWNKRVERLAERLRVFIDPVREEPLAPRVTEWGLLP